MFYHDELHWQQHSRSIWLKAGDKNTKLFHQRASQRRWKNHIHGVFDEGGNWCESEDDIGIVAEGCFQELFKSANPDLMGGNSGFS